MCFPICYARCTPFDAPCAGDAECVPLDGNQAEGRCTPRGSGKKLDACVPAAISTGCAAGLQCGAAPGEDSTTCHAPCDFFGAVTCPAGERCAYGGLCTSIGGDMAALGSPCALSSFLGTPCGLVGGRFEGLCAPTPSGAMVCRAACRVGGSAFGDCPGDQFCKTTEGEEALPVCQAAPVEEDLP